MLHLAAQKGKVEMTGQLLGLGADFHVLNLVTADMYKFENFRN